MITSFKKMLMTGAAVCALLLSSSAIHADWSDDPAVNLAVADRSGEQVQAKQVTRSDGKTFLSWFDNSTGGYDVYLQLLDVNGVELWAHNGVLVADRSFSSTQDYDLAVDSNGNALLAFRDDRGGSVNVTAAVVDANGTLLWGTDGVQLANGTDFVAAPKVAGTTDGSIVVAWTNNADAMLQKLDSTGSALWGAGIALSDGGGASFTVSDLNASTTGGVIVSMVRQINFSSPKHLYAQKLSADGVTLWGDSSLAVFDSGSLQFGNFPEFIPDGEGGAVFAWYDTSSGLQSYVQRILSGGIEAFSHNGVAVSTAARDHVSPVVAFDSVNDATFVFWREQMPGSFPEDAVYAQKLNVDGIRQWTDQGVVVAPLTTDELSQVRVSEYNQGMIVSWVKSLAFDNDRVLAAGIDSDGNLVWSPSTSSVATSVSGKSRLFIAGDPNDAVTVSWSDSRSDDNDVYIQNINADGSLGVSVPVILGDANGDGVFNNADIASFVLALTNSAAYQAMFPNVDPDVVLDMNDDGVFNNGDIASFVAALTGGGTK